MYIMQRGHRQVQVDNAKKRDKKLEEGYDVIDKTGKVLTPATGGRTYTAEEYNTLAKKLEKALKK